MTYHAYHAYHAPFPSGGNFRVLWTGFVDTGNNKVRESARINRHILGDGKALRKRRSDSIPAAQI